MTPLRAQPKTRSDYLLDGLTFAGIITYFLVSGMFLDSHGWPYSLAGSAVPLKIHPGSYLILSAFAVLLTRDNPIFVLGRLASRQPADFGYLVTMVGLILYTIARFGTAGSAFLVDLHVIPALAGLLLGRMRPGRLRFLFVLAVALLTLNAFIGIIEYATRSRLVPFTVDGKPVLELHFRSTSLLGFPLQNALMTSVALLSLPVLRDRPRFLAAAGLILAVAFIPFGGRSALATTALIGALVIPVWALRHLAGRNYGYGQLLGGLLVGLMALGAIALALTLGSDTRAFSGLRWDESANTRIIGLRILDTLTPLDVVFGIGPQQILERSKVLADYYGIIGLENSWLQLMLIFGLLGLLFMLAALFTWLREMLRGGPPSAYVATLAYLVIASTNNTLAAKDSSLLFLVVLVMGARAYVGAPAGHPGARPRRAPVETLTGATVR